MAKTNNLTDFLTDVADAIRDKKGTTAKINPQDFSSEIKSIEGGGTTKGYVTTFEGRSLAPGEDYNIELPVPTGLYVEYYIDIVSANITDKNDMNICEVKFFDVNDNQIGSNMAVSCADNESGTSWGGCFINGRISRPNRLGYAGALWTENDGFTYGQDLPTQQVRYNYINVINNQKTSSAGLMIRIFRREYMD